MASGEKGLAGSSVCAGSRPALLTSIRRWPSFGRMKGWRTRCPDQGALNSTFEVRMRDSKNRRLNSPDEPRSLPPNGTVSPTKAGLRLNALRLEAYAPPVRGCSAQIREWERFFPGSTGFDRWRKRHDAHRRWGALGLPSETSKQVRADNAARANARLLLNPEYAGEKLPARCLLRILLVFRYHPQASSILHRFRTGGSHFAVDDNSPGTRKCNHCRRG